MSSGDFAAAKVAVGAAVYPIDKPYEYGIPGPLRGRVEPGMRVSVPFGTGNRQSDGVVLSLVAESVYPKLKYITSVLDGEPVLSDEHVKLAVWIGDRFFCTVYDAFRAMLPTGMWFKDGGRRTGDKTIRTVVLKIPCEDAAELAERKRARAPAQAAVLDLLAREERMALADVMYFTGARGPTVRSLEATGAVRVEYVQALRRPEIKPALLDGELALTQAQRGVYEELEALTRAGGARAAVLYGVTGSGKTSVYIELIKAVTGRGGTAIVLVPEIALTPQLVALFSAHFGDGVAVMHSALAAGERCDEWKRIRRGDVSVVVGTRSAIFAPLKNIGLIILDEEQEYTYKSENSPRYHARDVAKYRCAHWGALLLLGSATPSVESMYGAATGRYALMRLPDRYNERDLPPVIIADMKNEVRNGNGGSISSVLEREIYANIERGEQSILFINRRGANTLIACPECGFTHTCAQCSVSMTYHSANGRLMCHYCGYSEPVRSDCPKCGGRLKYVGAGTQKVESELRALFPRADIIRMDTDTVAGANTHETLLSRFREERVPILIGTQMVTKGLDFENVTLVGVISADMSLYINDYRAHERTFSLITQVIGRSGRGGKPGRAVIQTYTPANEVILLAAKQDYDSFYAREIKLREITGSPPVTDIFVITASGPDEGAVIRGCMRLRGALEGYLGDVGGLKLLGPAPAPVVKINGRYRYRLSLCCAGTKRIRNTIAHTIKEFSKDRSNRGVSAYADVCPYD
ncbi:MAG: primosomal protein N' [Oscillospiraceae bacterium]|jgi:primosomal protein N' (replication factor Y)|nr:primosomal protein N' [Oscillospiraceae bacterium]